LDWEWKQLDLGRKLRAALMWADIAFAGFWKVWWDNTRGSDVDVLVYGQDHEQAGSPVLNGKGAPLKPDDAESTYPPSCSPRSRRRR
jgi:hypothetical protein